MSLLSWQQRFRAEPDARERRRLGLQFQRIVRENYGQRLERILYEIEAPPARVWPARRGTTLLERVVNNSFNPSRHAGLLEGEELPAVCPVKARKRVWDELRATQCRYQLISGYPDYAECQYEASVGGVRQLYCSEFGLLVGALHSGKVPARLHGRH